MDNRKIMNFVLIVFLISVQTSPILDSFIRQDGIVQAEEKETKTDNSDENNDTSSGDEENSSGSSDSSSGKSDNKDTETETETKARKAKTTPNYKGGTEQKVNKEPIQREYVQDPRRSVTDPIRFLSDDPTTKSLMEEVTEKVNSAVGGKNLLVYSTDGMFSFSPNIYTILSDEDKKKIMSYALKSIKESELPNRVKTKASNFIKEQDPKIATVIEALNSDTSSELAEGYAWFIPFTNPISTVLGSISIVIIMFIVIRSSIDLIYFTNGLLRSLLDKGEGKPKLISSEAWETAKEVDGGMEIGDYRDYIPVYLSKVIPITVFSVVVVSWLASGYIYKGLSIIMEIIETIIKAVFGI